MKNKLLGLIAIVTLIVGATTSANALPWDPIEDLGLSVGDTYHYVFITGGYLYFTSSNIDDYNAFVTSEANRVGSMFETDGLDWFAIGSTSTVNARDNAVIGLDAPVFMADGYMVANGFEDMWDGDLNRGIFVNQFGFWETGDVYTGSQTDGTRGSTGWLGDDDGDLDVWIGLGGIPGNDWISDSLEYEGALFHAHMYALSEAIVVAAPVPEPSTLLLLGIGLAGLAFTRRKGKRQ